MAELWPLEIFLAGIFLRNADRVEIEDIVVGFCEPNNVFVAA